MMVKMRKMDTIIISRIGIVIEEKGLPEEGSKTYLRSYQLSEPECLDWLQNNLQVGVNIVVVPSLRLPSCQHAKLRIAVSSEWRACRATRGNSLHILIRYWKVDHLGDSKKQECGSVLHIYMRKTHVRFKVSEVGGSAFKIQQNIAHGSVSVMIIHTMITRLRVA